MAKVVLENVYKSFSQRRQNQSREKATNQSEVASHSWDTLAQSAVLRRINLTVNDGEFMVLVGPSGCGKSTLLRLIAGLEELSAGNIWVGDVLVNELLPKDRNMAMVFQSYALYPFMNVYDNIAFGLRRTNQQLASKSDLSHPQLHINNWLEHLLVMITRSLPPNLRYLSAQEKAVDQRVRMVADLLQIESLLDRLPKQLSGGQKQRVALGRAIARNPQVFLMDEPLSNLDAKLRTETRANIVKLQRHLGTTTIYVTHDQTEAMTMGDRIAIMHAGQIQQIAPPLAIYNRPVNKFVAEFIGSPPMNFLSVQFQAPLLITLGQFRFTLPDVWKKVLKNYDGRTLILGIRPEDLSIAVPALKNFQVQVDLVEALGNDTYLHVSLIDLADHGVRSNLQVRVEPDRSVQIGEELWLSIAISKIHLFDPETELALIPSKF